MPKKIKLEDLKLSKRPSISVIDYNNGKVKYLYICGAEGERYRISSGYTDKKDATRYARQLENDLDPAVRKQNAENQIVSISPVQLFDLYIQAKERGQEQKRLEKYGPSPSIAKLKTLKKHLEDFLAQWNLLPREQKHIEADRTIDRIEFANQITTYWLEHVWRPTWFSGKGSFWSMLKRLELVSAIWHFGITQGYLQEQHSEKNCKCTACRMMRPKKQTKTVQRTPPFELSQYAQVVEACDKFEVSYRDLNSEQLRISNQRLRAFIEVMRYCGPRISDATLMRKDAINVLKNGKANWSYCPLKNGDEGNPITIPLPKHVLQQLEALPDAPGFHPEYFFWTGYSTLRNAADPWHRALTRLWTLCPEEAKEIRDIRNKQKVNPSSHMFRNTFCVQCRLAGMTYAQIADAIGDTEEMVKKHYSAYCREYDQMIAEKVESMQTMIERMQSERASHLVQ
jgi:hypothetical protein